MANHEIEKKLQEKVLTYRILENRLDSLVKQQNVFLSRAMEIENTIESIDEIKKEGKDLLFPIGAAAYARGDVTDKNKLIVEVGAGVLLEKTADEGKTILEKRKREIQNAVEALQQDLQNVSETMQKIETDTQKILGEAQKKEEKFKVISDSR